jgi:ribose 5-phosphate isomerase A
MPTPAKPTIAERALKFIQSGMVIGLGSGRAASAFIQMLGSRKVDVAGVPTSEKTAALARQLGIPLVSLADATKGGRLLDFAVDGADEVDPGMNMIKGRGRALLREKIVAASAKRLIILVGQDKLVDQLGMRGQLPVEVVPFGLPLCQRRLEEIDCKPTLFANTDGTVFETDNGNYILDCQIGPICDPWQLERALQAIPGVAGTGLFLSMADSVLVGDQDNQFQLLEEKHR